MKKRIIIDASEFTTPHNSHIIMKEAFDCEEYYGNNLDALHDVLTSISGEKVHVTLKNFDIALEQLGDYANKIKRVFEDSASENEYLSFKIK